MDELSVHHEVVLLGLHDERGSVSSYTDVAVAGAVIAELVEAARVEVVDDEVRVTDDAATGDTALDAVLDEIAAATRPKSVTHWMWTIGASADVRTAVVYQLVDRGVLRVDTRSFLRVVKWERFPEVDPGPEMRVRERIRQAVLGDDPAVDDRTRLLVSIASAAELLGTVLDRRERRDREERIAWLTDGEGFGGTLSTAIANIQAAMVAAATMTTITTTT